MKWFTTLAFTALSTFSVQEVTGQLPPGADPELYKVLASIGAFDVGLVEYETPMAIRFTSLITSLWWNCIATYSDSFKDALTQERPQVVVGNTALHTTKNRAKAVAHASLLLAEQLIPNTKDALYGAYTDPSINVTVQFGVDAALESCGSFADLDIDCLQEKVKAAEAGNNHTRIVGQAMALQVIAYAAQDGWNQFGDADGCVVNCEPFRDTTGFKIKRGRQKWRPMEESNGRGFFNKAQHVAPHIGKKGHFRFLDEAERKERKAPNPDYSRRRKKEAEKVIERMRDLDDKKKVEIEFFDNKLEVTELVVQTFIGMSSLHDTWVDNSPLKSPKSNIKCSFERAVNFVMALTNSEYDSTIIVWKEKVRHNLVRPTTVIQRWGKKEISTWSPYDNGEHKTFPAKNFEAYKRVMPHAEYPSGSSCLCRALSDATRRYFQNIGFDDDIRLERAPFKAGQSKVEPGSTPAQDTILSYKSVVELAKGCSQSRLDGGMHFDASVPSGEELCNGIGTEGADWAKLLYDDE